MILGGILMDKIAYFRLQAKNLMRDFRTQTLDEEGLTRYSPKFFNDIDDILLSYNVDEENFTLMEAQYLIANLAGFDKWAELLRASDDALELGKLLLDKRGEISLASFTSSLVDDWKMYLQINHFSNESDEFKLQVFKAVFLGEYSCREEKTR